MSTTLEHPVPVIETPIASRRPKWVLVIAAVALLAIGVLGGWWIGSRGDQHPRAVAAGYQTLTDRQQQMLDVLDRGEAAWRSGDGAALVALFTPDAVLVNPTGTFGVDALAAGVVASPDIELLEPVLFDGNVATIVERYESQGDLVTEVFEFTTTGDVLISHYTAFVPAP